MQLSEMHGTGNVKSLRKKMDAFPYTSLFPGPTVRFDQSTEYCSTVKLIRVGWCMFYSLKVHNIGYILLKQTPLKTPETLKEKFAVVSLQTKKLFIVIKVVRNEAIGRVFCNFREITPSSVQC